MELAEGGRLTDLLTRFGRLPEVNVRFYAAQIFIALSFLHEQNILHRDLKLDNVLLDGAGFIRLCDFGLSVDGFQDDGLVNSPCGTFVYVAPEVFRNSYGKAADWWSYGVLLYLMATGRLPFGGKNIKELFVAITRREPFYDSFLSSALVSLLKRLLSKSARDRPGYKSSGDKRPLAADPFFAGVDWLRLQTHSMTPPPLPKRRLQTSRPSENLSSAASHAFLSASFPAAQSLSSPLQRDWQSKTTRSGSLSMTGLPAV
ncbi:protein kinase C-like 2 isoform X1 [Pomacea canaliculata]|uniref:protein kinase C-like 2 isoform X1 n=1 Tax=Pomacea canaliculata TaxID=400727 RepID=UPI000D731509|nr:protein kinase C-like 2 isoform X1 [Pomacea canaliculata]